MAKTPSNMIPLGTLAPNFTLPDVVSGKTISLEDAKSNKGTVIMFICNHCPFVKHIQNKLVDVANRYLNEGFTFIAINSNDTKHYPDDSPDKMKSEALAHGYNFPYLFDESQQVAKSYQAACTPDFYLFDKNLKCVYRGRFDDATPGNQKEVTGKDLSDALDALLREQDISPNQHPSVGCNIKWKNLTS